MNKEKLNAEDILNATGSLLNIMMDYAENSHKEIEELEKENTNLKQALNEIREYVNNTDTMVINGKVMQLKDEQSGNDILRIIDKVLGGSDE